MIHSRRSFTYCCLIFFYSSFAHAVPDNLKNIRKQTRALLEQKNCATCHVPNLPSSNSAALRVFNLNRVAWVSTITDKQLDGLLIRTKQGTASIRGKLTLEDLEPKAAPF